ncbi:MAG: saccharopine dehydrogenase NADP-binding domain-containing protein [Deltaproteobacteria bacterium]|nr:saccharopine dehydrogenase NADP-binding domain-containing protein [Deltaproteobacteria bacterium]
MNYLILGSGRMARGLVHFLRRRDPDASIRVVDVVSSRARALARWAGGPVTAGRLDLADRAAVRRALARADVAVSAAHYRFNPMLTAEAALTRTHLVDLGGNNDVVAKQLKLASRVARAGVTVVPDTGLAPGMTNLLALWAIQGMDRVASVRIRVGGVPLKPVPPFDYQLVFATEGLINEYVEDALVLRAGKVRSVPSLTDVETLRFPPPFGRMEAFNTSGGASTLIRTLKGRVKDLDYKTIRYPGHCEKMHALKHLGLMDDRAVRLGGQAVRPRALTGLLLERGLPSQGPDAVLVRVSAEGVRGGRRRKVRINLVDTMDRRTGLTAMMRCTAFPSACIAWMLGRGLIDAPGVHEQESVVPVGRFVREMRGAGLRIRRA